jgi:hypothetical protein
LLDGSALTIRDFIDAPAGKARWYRVPVAAGQRLDIKLTGLPADYDLAVFKDIAQAFSNTKLNQYIKHLTIAARGQNMARAVARAAQCMARGRPRAAQLGMVRTHTRAPVARAAHAARAGAHGLRNLCSVVNIGHSASRRSPPMIGCSPRLTRGRCMQGAPGLPHLRRVFTLGRWRPGRLPIRPPGHPAGPATRQRTAIRGDARERIHRERRWARGIGA